MTNTTQVTQEAWGLHARLYAADSTVPRSVVFLQLLTRLRRDARMKATQAENACSYEWADGPDYQKLMSDTDKRLAIHGDTLRMLWRGARLETADNPREYVVRIVPPNGRGSCLLGGVGVA